ncbi:hypothetical protein BDZ89DRAFT_1035242 [Hymenopellis radicata]|nr:hypothetical protein BDZ89DRAFT_1035242 [Hymenopellis radicata]
MFNSYSSRSQIDELLNWEIAPAVFEPGAIVNSSVASTSGLAEFLVPSSNAAPPPASTHVASSLSGTPSVISLTHAVTARESGWVPIPRDGIPDLCDFHLRPELILKNAILLPGLAEYFGTICDAELSRNQALLDLDDYHEYSTVWREMGHFLKEEFQATVKSAHDVQVFSEYREIIAAGAASAFLNRSPNAWKTTPFISWRRDTSRRDGSVQSYMHIEQSHLDELRGTRTRLCTSLETAVEQSCMPFQVYYFTRPGFLSDELVAAMESLFSADEPIPWMLCDYPNNNCPSSLASLCGEHSEAHGVPISVGRSARPDSVDVSHIINSVNRARTAANITVKKRALGKLSKSPTWKVSLGIASALRKTIWLKLLAIDGTYATLGDGNREYIFVRHRKSQTLVMSTCLDVTRSPKSNKNAPHMKVRIGMNIAATFDVAARGLLAHSVVIKS